MRETTEHNLYFSLDNLAGALLQLHVPSDLFPTLAANTAFWLTQYGFKRRSRCGRHKALRSFC